MSKKWKLVLKPIAEGVVLGVVMLAGCYTLSVITEKPESFPLFVGLAFAGLLMYLAGIIRGANG